MCDISKNELGKRGGKLKRKGFRGDVEGKREENQSLAA